MRRLTDFSKVMSIPGICALLFLIAYSATLVVGVALIVPWRAHAQAAVDSSAELAKQLAEAKATVAALDARVATVQTMLTALTGVGTLLGLIVGFTTFWNLAKIQKTATEDLAEIRADFPAIGHLNHKIKRLLEEMNAYRQLKTPHLDPEVYGKLSASARQDILVREMTFNGLSMFDYAKVPELNESTANAFLIFGHFYGSWYMNDIINIGASERSILYLQKALESGGPGMDVVVKTSLGVLFAWRSDTSDPDSRKKMLSEALRNYEAVLDKEPANPRALLGAAYVDDEQGRTSDAILDLDKIVKQKSTVDDPQIIEIAYYNRACCQAKIGNLDKAMADFWDLRSLTLNPNDHTKFEKYVKDLDDEVKKGTLDKLLASIAHKQEFDNFKDPNYKRL